MTARWRRRGAFLVVGTGVLLGLAWGTGVLERAAFFLSMNSPRALVDKLRDEGLVGTVQAVLDKLSSDDSIPTLRYSLADPADWPAADDAAERAALPEFRSVPAVPTAELRPPTGHQPDHRAWTRSHGNEFSDKFADLAQITPANVAQLELAWTFRSGVELGDPKQIGQTVQTNPVYAAGRLFVTDLEGRLYALDAGSGREIWRLQLPVPVARRGLVWQPHADFAQSRLFVPTGTGVFAVGAADGQVVQAWGEKGRVGDQLSLISPSIVGDTLVIATTKPALEGYDLATGRLKWRRLLLEKLPRRQGAYVYGGAPWAGMSSDASRGLVFVALGNPRPQLVGSTRHGDNRHSCSVVAVDVGSGEIRWAHQEVAHDLWDLDIPAPPVLTTVTHEGRRVDVVAAATKLGNVLVLDRDSGRPLFAQRWRRAPPSTLPGERTAAYQPDFERPVPFTKPVFERSDITDLSAAATAYVEHKLRDARLGGFEPPVLGGTVAAFGMQGGAEWPGAAVDPRDATLFVPSNQIPWLLRVNLIDTKASLEQAEKLPGHAAYLERCAACHKPERHGYWEGEREGDVYVPSLMGVTFLRTRERLQSPDEFERAHRRSGIERLPSEAELRSLWIYFSTLDTQADRARSFIMDAYWQLLLDDRGHPGSKPPWGHLTAIDLNTGLHRWQVPFGTYEDLRRDGQPVRGQRNTGGVIATASGLLFATGTVDDKLRAYAAADGRELWAYKLPAAGSAPPTTYLHEGRQYVVVMATGGTHIGFSGRSDQMLAFRLPAPATGGAPRP